MRRFNLLIFALLMTWSLQAQFINNGATVVIQSGATLKVETNFVNNSGTVTNYGTLEVTGNFENNATFTSADPSSLVIFSGNGPSTVKSGGAVLRNVEMDKTSANTELTDAMEIAGDLSFTGTASKLVLGNNNLTLASTSAVNTAGANGYVVTNGSGALIKGITADGTKNMEVGDMNNYSPVSNVITGSLYTSATISARAYTGGLQPKYAETTDYIDREWNVVADGIADYANTMTGTYAAPDDVPDMSTLIKGATYHTGDWRFDGSSGNGTDLVTASTTTDDVLFSGKNFFGKANLKVFLAGPYNAGSMSTALNSILPVTTPYTAAPFNAPSENYSLKPANATDWILVELRDAASPSTILGQKSAWLLSDGSIVGLDGGALRIKNGNPSSIVAIRHRNHLGVRTASGIDVVNPTLFDFSNTAVFGTNPQRNISGTFAMWPGNTLVDGNIKYTGSDNDLDPILNNILSQPANFFGLTTYTYSGYNNYDVNMDGTIKYTGSDNDSDLILNNVLAHPSNLFGLITFIINQQL